MFNQLHTINCNRNPSTQDILGGNYPISMNLDNFMDLFTDVKSLNVNASVLSLNISASVTDSPDVTDFTDTTSSNTSDDSVFIGSSVRIIKQVGQINKDFSNLLISLAPTALCEYPYFSSGGATNSGGAILIIDLGKTLFSDGLFFPWISLSFSNGAGSGSGGLVLGSITFDRYGEIPIFAGDSVGAVTLAIAGGQITVQDRYSSLQLSSQNVSSGDSLTITTPDSASRLLDLSIYTKAYFGAVQTATEASKTSLSITVPENAESGPIRIEGPLPNSFDFFLTPWINIS